MKKPYKPIKVAGPDMQSKILKFLREVMNYALEKDDITKNVAKAKFLTRVFKKSKPLIDPLMADDAGRFLGEVEKLPLDYFKVSVLLLLNTGMRPEEMLAIHVGDIAFDGSEASINIVSVLDRDGKTIRSYPKSDAGRRSVPIDAYTAGEVKAWIDIKSNQMKALGLKPSMSMLVCGPDVIPRTYQSWLRDWRSFIGAAGFEGIRPYALRHTFATLNLANGENIKTVSVLMGHASSAYTLDLYAGYVPNTGIGIGSRYMSFLRAAGSSRSSYAPSASLPLEARMRKQVAGMSSVPFSCSLRVAVLMAFPVVSCVMSTRETQSSPVRETQSSRVAAFWMIWAKLMPSSANTVAMSRRTP